MPERYHDICYLQDSDGALVPAARDRDAVGLDAIAGRQIALHVFATDGEAKAFAAGLALHASNHLRLRLGAGPVGHVAALEYLDADGPGGVELVDHGGARAYQNANRWSWLSRLVRVYDGRGHRSPTLMFLPPLGDRPGELKVDHHTFGVDQDDGALALSCPIAVDPATLQARIAASPATRGPVVTFSDGRLSLRLPKTELIAQAKAIQAILEVLWTCQFDVQRAAERARTRQDRRYCRVVELMLQGWTLQNRQGQGELRPPPGSPHKMRVLGYSMLAHLVDVRLIRSPTKTDRGQRDWGVYYEVGDLDGSAVRRPETGRAAPKARAPKVTR